MSYFKWCKFEQLAADELYYVLKLRQEVFVIEQNCLYSDIDGLDPLAWHLLGFQSLDCLNLMGYLRVFPPGVKYDELSIGRVVVAQHLRLKNLGKSLILEGLQRIESTFGKLPIKIAAQARLQKFYEGFNFKKCSSPYLEDNILHIEMIRQV